MSNSQTKVVVTGMGATTPLGGDLPSTWSALLDGKSGVRRLEWEGVDELPVQFAAQLAVDPSEVMTKQQLRRLDRCQALALIAAHEAWKSAGFAPPTKVKKGKDDASGAPAEGFVVDGDRLGVVLSTGIGGLHTALSSYEVFLEKGWSRVSPFTVPMLMPNGSSGHVGIEFGAMAGSHAMVSACASSAEAVGYAIDMIRAGRADIIICGGTEACIHPLQMASFGSMRAMSTRNDEPTRASRPYDKNRDGFVLGEGAAVMILESEEHARARGADIHGIAAGCGYSGDAYDIVLPDPSGAGQAKAMRRALQDAGVEATDIAHINAHATSTPAGDVAELASIKAALGAEASSKVIVTATKSMTGHLLGGAGALESLFTILALRDGVIPPTANLEDIDDDVDLDIVRGEPRKLPEGPAAAMNNSFGFGGHNVSVIFKRYE
ncbi:beta-ketoacyl-[acyl-carrier-protein] synthase family protein [Spirillospora sp. CA-294931]|uniref:beta-ketoacyl-[acyl-carrier-protein] synthase family protein n=1 Tax=Spirillospora sp. CA-294931 TaxID=3240042 RepID=UPI003D8D4473